MGWWDSSEEQVIKDNQINGLGNGNISNVILGDSADTLLILVIILTVLKFLEFAFVIYTGHVRKIKKRYNNAHPNNCSNLP